MKNNEAELEGMDFRDVEYFDQAMLSKQFWRLLINPNSLVAKIMREKYFKQWSILASKLVCGLHRYVEVFGGLDI